ncbi:MAG: DUF4167 domain-containing protein [Rhodospirillales bacterium]|jgi:hypothetical protein|nr:DUF4167 domain-containing protein [Rhodospirillales bacterium]
MKHGSPSRRLRSRGNGRRHGSHKNQSFESNGPEVKVRGTAQQVLEKYQVLARDASLSGDRIAAEGYYQYAEHYFRLANTDADPEAHPGVRQGAKTPGGGSSGQKQDAARAQTPGNSGGDADRAQPSESGEQPARGASEEAPADEGKPEPVQA